MAAPDLGYAACAWGVSKAGCLRVAVPNGGLADGVTVVTVGRITAVKCASKHPLPDKTNPAAASVQTDCVLVTCEDGVTFCLRAEYTSCHASLYQTNDPMLPKLKTDVCVAAGNKPAKTQAAVLRSAMKDFPVVARAAPPASKDDDEDDGSKDGAEDEDQDNTKNAATPSQKPTRMDMASTPPAGANSSSSSDSSSSSGSSSSSSSSNRSVRPGGSGSKRKAPEDQEANRGPAPKRSHSSASNDSGGHH
jgi:uncharacterized membrane protein YgcG